MKHTLQNGVIVEWRRDNVFSKYVLHVVGGEENIQGQCGNPWNMMSSQEEDAKIRATRPPREQRNVCGIGSLLSNHVITKDTMKTEMEYTISADCWSVFVMSNDRKELIRVYYDHRIEPEYDSFEDVRGTLCNDSSDLMQHVEHYQTVVCVMGGDESRPFKEYYYSKLSEPEPEVYLESIVDHSINW